MVLASLDSTEWDVSPACAGAIGSAALIGMFFGPLVVGTITDIVGRRKIMLICITWFSLGMVLCALAPTPELLWVFRFITGLGLGGVVPTAIATTIEYCPRRRRHLSNAVLLTEYKFDAFAGQTTSRDSE